MIHRIFGAGFVMITILFVLSALALIVFASLELYNGVNPFVEMEIRQRFNAILESVGLLTIAVAALELGQTILEEEVQRQAHISAPTRVRRFLSRFIIVIIVSLAIETLIAVFQFTHEDPQLLPQAATIGVAAGVLMAAWGFFVKANRSAEELEPEAMEQAKREDQEVNESKG